MSRSGGGRSTVGPAPGAAGAAAGATGAAAAAPAGTGIWAHARDGAIPAAYWTLWLQTIACLVLIRGLTFTSFHLYDSVWQYVGLRDLRAIAASVTLLVHYSFGESWFYSRVPTLWIAALIWVLLCVRHVTRKSSGD